jgi:hypothetical protein
MITDDDVKKLKTVFATKEDLADVKEDLNRFATKDDLKRFATKNDLRGFATKNDVEAAKQEMLERYDEKSDRILEFLDSFAGEIKDHRMKEMIHGQKHDDIAGRLDKIEKVPVVAHELRKHAD